MSSPMCTATKSIGSSEAHLCYDRKGHEGWHTCHCGTLWRKTVNPTQKGIKKHEAEVARFFKRFNKMIDEAKTTMSDFFVTKKAKAKAKALLEELQASINRD